MWWQQVDAVAEVLSMGGAIRGWGDPGRAIPI